MGGTISMLDPQADFRAKATERVALAALTLVLPFVLVNLAQHAYLLAAGSGAIVAMLALNVWLVAHGRSHERLTLWGLVPGAMLFMIHVFLYDGVIATNWCYPAILGCYCMLSRHRAMVANAIIAAVALPMIWITLELPLAARFTSSLIGISVFAGILVREIDAMRERLHFQIEHDPLTGLLNRVSLAERLADAIDARASGHAPSALISVDLDHFKAINDSLGHEAGDLVLQEVARLLRQHVRPDDAVFRLGGEEFLVLLHDAGPRAALERAETLRERIEHASILQHGRVTASFGVAMLRAAPEDAAAWMRRSDRRLYAAKRTGRNRVVWCGESDMSGSPVPLVEAVAGGVR